MAPLADPVRDRAIVCLGFNSVSSFRRNRRRARVDLALPSSRRGLRRHKPAVCSSPILHSYSPPGQAAVSAQLSPPTPSAQVRRFPPLGPARASLLPRSRSPVHGSLRPFRRPAALSDRARMFLQVRRSSSSILHFRRPARPRSVHSSRRRLRRPVAVDCRTSQCQLVGDGSGVHWPLRSPQRAVAFIGAWG
jgi:hypothetical protein